MNPEELLSQLAPLREPPAIGWWPPAPGWWLVGVVLLASVSGLLMWWLRRRHHSRYRRQAEQQLNQIIAEGSPDLAAVNRLLKATALRGYPVSASAQLTGDAWIQFLSEQTPKGDPSAWLPLQSVYQQPDAPAPDALLDATRYWLKHHRGQHD